MANPSVSITKFALSADKLKPGSEFTIALSVKNNLGKVADLLYCDGHIVVTYNNYGNEMEAWISFYSSYNSSSKRVSIANGATYSTTITGVVKESVKDELEHILSIDPNANVRCNDIVWQVHLESLEDFTYRDDAEYKTGKLYDTFYAPAVEAFQLERSMDGVPNDEGETLLTTMKLGIGEEYRLELLSLKIYYAENAAATTSSPFIDLTASIPDLLTGVADSAELITQTFVNISNWNFLLVFGDAYESASAAFSVSRAFANVHLSGKSTGGVALGGFSTSEEGDPKFESHYPAHFYAGISDFGASIQIGYVYSISVKANSCAEGTVTFDTPFKSTPVIILQPLSYSASASYGSITFSISGGNTLTTDGFGWRVHNAHTAALTPSLRWVAIGKM